MVARFLCSERKFEIAPRNPRMLTREGLGPRALAILDSFYNRSMLLGRHEGRGLFEVRNTEN
jgi:hypothetical protein